MKIVSIKPECNIEEMIMEGIALKDFIQGTVQKIWLNPEKRLVLLMNDGAKLLDLPYNDTATLIYHAYHNNNDTIEGNAVICSFKNDHYCSITQRQLKEIRTWLFIKRYCDDPDNIMNGRAIEGVYQISYHNPWLGIEISAYIGEAGKVVGAPWYTSDNIADRLFDHMHAWIAGDYMTYWIGLTNSNLTEEGWRLRFKCLAEERDMYRRKDLESSFIEQYRPFLQHVAEGRFSLWKTSYDRPDLVIHPFNGQRREAFLYRIATT